MKVKATKLGYYGIELRRPGDVFDIADDEFSARWMEPVSTKKYVEVEATEAEHKAATEPDAKAVSTAQVRTNRGRSRSSPPPDEPI